MKPTAEQSNILDFIATEKSNLMIRARAGCGKSATLKLIDQAATTAQPYLVICFNKSIADEARQSGEFRTSTTIKTMNAIGHGIWAEYCNKKLKLSKSKIHEIFKSIVDEASRDERTNLWSVYNNVTEAVNMARALGYIPDAHAKASARLIDFPTLERYLDETVSAEVKGIVDKILTKSISLAYDGTIDFNDQCYMPALFGGMYPRFPVVLVDEYQDLSPINRAMVAKLCKSSRQIGVGDEAQAIYEFRGADAQAMPKAIREFSMEVLPLSTSFRCPSEITSNVHWHVPDIRSFSEGGLIEEGDIASIPTGAAVICRYNAPLLHLAMTLLSQGQRVDVAGVDIGNRVIKLLTKLGPEELTQSQTIYAINQWQSERESLDSKSASDTADCMRVFARRGKTLGAAIAYAKHIFSTTEGEIKFMSGHKAKGREFDHVFHLNKSQIKHGGQEQNIHYVIDSRPRERLTYIEME